MGSMKESAIHVGSGTAYWFIIIIEGIHQPLRYITGCGRVDYSEEEIDRQQRSQEKIFGVALKSAPEAALAIAYLIISGLDVIPLISCMFNSVTVCMGLYKDIMA